MKLRIQSEHLRTLLRAGGLGLALVAGSAVASGCAQCGSSDGAAEAEQAAEKSDDGGDQGEKKAAGKSAEGDKKASKGADAKGSSAEGPNAAQGQDEVATRGEAGRGEARGAEARAAAKAARSEAPTRAEGSGAAEAQGADEDPQAARERRLAELKARTEERRQERLARMRAAQGEGAGAEGEVPGADDAAAADALAPGTARPPVPGAGEAALPEATARGEADASAGPPPAARPAPTPSTTTSVVQPPVAPAAPRGLDIDRYLTINDVRTLTGERTLAPLGGLAGIPPSDIYNSAYFAPPARANFGVSLQVWNDKTRRDVNERFRRMRRDYPNAEDTSAVTAKGFFAYWNDIMMLTFMHFDKRIIVTVSCSQAICTPEELFKLATTVKERL